MAKRGAVGGLDAGRPGNHEQEKAEGIHIPSSVLVRAEMKSQEPKEDSRSAQP